MQKVLLTRRFAYNGIKLSDPNPALSPEEVRQLFVPQYTELMNAVIEGPVTEGDTLTYTFRRAAGAKGRIQSMSKIRGKLKAIASGQCQPSGADTIELNAVHMAKMRNAFKAMITVTQKKRVGQSLPLPSAAFGLWG